VLAIGFVPDGRDFDTGLRGLNARGKLRLCLVGETVAHTDRESRKLPAHAFTHLLFIDALVQPLLQPSQHIHNNGFAQILLKKLLPARVKRYI
jgi:hypothetical protein